jgi:hypothetical protein
VSNHLYGRYQVAETTAELVNLHVHEGTADVLSTVDWEPKVGVLDQEDLIAQGIDTSVLVPGAKKVDALGSCTANAGTAALSNVLDEASFIAATGATSYADVVGAEKFAIRFYSQCTHQTGDPGQEWPPTDCGSSGPYVVKELEAMKLITGAQIANDATSIVSLMQGGGLIVGQPFFNSWEEPDAQGFIDGDGSAGALKAAMRSGVAGGHETYWSAIEHLALVNGRVDALNTVIRFRNSWTKSWGDNGSARAHLSTFMWLASHCDFRRLI